MAYKCERENLGYVRTEANFLHLPWVVLHLAKSLHRVCICIGVRVFRHEQCLCHHGCLVKVRCFRPISLGKSPTGATEVMQKESGNTDNPKRKR